MPLINSVEYPVQGNKCGVVVGKSEFKKAFKHMIYTYYQSMVHMDNNNNNLNTMDSSSNPSNTDHDNSIVDSSLQSNTEALLISPSPSPSPSLHTDYSDEEDQQEVDLK